MFSIKLEMQVNFTEGLSVNLLDPIENFYAARKGVAFYCHRL